MNKEEIIKTLHDNVDALHTKLDELKVTANLGKKDMQQSLQPEIDKIEAQIDDARVQISKLSHLSSEAMGDIKEGVGLAMTSISEALKSAGQRFK